MEQTNGDDYTPSQQEKTTVSGHEIVELSRAESLHLLQFESFVGRVAFAVDGHVHVRPVNYLAGEDGLVFCTGQGSVFAAVAQGVPIVFEVDAGRPLDHSGWSVIVRGTAHEITDPAELARLRRGPLRSWAVSPAEHWIQLDIEEISGVRIPVH